MAMALIEYLKKRGATKEVTDTQTEYNYDEARKHTGDLSPNKPIVSNNSFGPFYFDIINFDKHR